MALGCHDDLFVKQTYPQQLPLEQFSYNFETILVNMFGKILVIFMRDNLEDDLETILGMILETISETISGAICGLIL